MSLSAVSAWLARPSSSRQPLYANITRLGLFLFGVEVVTGVLLALYYRASPEAAYGSVRFVTNAVTMGWLIRSMHLAAAHAIVVLAALIVAQVFFRRAFLEPRGRARWVVNVLLLFTMLAFFATGEALPWDQTAYWRTVFTAEMAEDTPIVGGALSAVLRGSPQVDGVTLARLYIAHVVLLPWAAFWLLAHGRRLNEGGDA